MLPLPVPCADRPGDLTGFLLEGFGSPAGTVAVLGQAFRPGDLPRGTRLQGRLADGRAIPVQLDPSVRHPDGSVRFGIVSLLIPALDRDQRLGVVLSRSSEASATAEAPLNLEAALAGRQAVVTVTPAGGGQAWQADLLALLRAAATEPAGGRPWQSGPLAVQRRVTAPVPLAAVGGATSMRLVADIAARADGTLWVDLWLRNDVAMRPGGGAAAYSVRLALDGREVLRTGDLRHFQYQGWGRLVGASPGGQPPAAQPLLRPDTAYLAETGAVANYDLSTGVEEGVLTGFARAIADPAWGAPLGARQITRYMPTAGGRGDLGITTMYQAAWLASGDPRAAVFVLGQAEAAGAVPWHLHDPRGGWMDERRWPDFWTDARNGPPPKSLLQPENHEEAQWWPEAAHQPDLSFVPYLLTGRRAFLDELQAQAAWNVLSVWPGQRNEPGAARGVNLINTRLGREVRAGAWALRQLAEAAWISPDGDPHQAYFREVAAANWKWLASKTREWTALEGEAHGYIPNENDTLAPWQQDYIASVAAAAAKRGDEDARAFLGWMSNFIVGRFRAEGRGFPRRDGIAFAIAIAPGRQNTSPFKTWAEIGRATRQHGMSNGDGWSKSGGEYGRLGLQSLAMLYNALGTEEALQAYAWLLSARPDFSSPQDHAQVPTNNIVPRGMPRLPGRLVRCAATQERRR